MKELLTLLLLINMSLNCSFHSLVPKPLHVQKAPKIVKYPQPLEMGSPYSFSFWFRSNKMPVSSRFFMVSLMPGLIRGNCDDPYEGSCTHNPDHLAIVKSEIFSKSEEINSLKIMIGNEQLDQIELEANSKTWHFIAIQLEANGASIFIKSFSPLGTTTALGKTRMIQSMLEERHVWFEIGGSKKTSGNFGFLQDLRLHTFKIENLEVLSFFNHFIELDEYEGIKSFFNMATYPETRSIEPYGRQAKVLNLPPSLTFSYKGLRFSQNEFLDIPLENYPLLTLIKSPSVIMDIEIKQFSGEILQLFKFDTKDTTFIAALTPQNDTNSFDLHLSVKSKDQEVNTSFSGCFKETSYHFLGVSLIQTAENFITFLALCDSKLFRSEDFIIKNVNLSQLNFTLLNSNQTAKFEVIISSLVILDTSLPLAISGGGIEQRCTSTCSIRTSKKRGCLSCLEGVLSPYEPICLPHCPPKYRSIRKKCSVCETSTCLEAEPSHAYITPISERSFLLNLSKPIPLIPSKDLFRHSIFSIEPPSPSTTILVNPVNDTQLRIDIEPKQSLLNSTLYFSFNQSSYISLYDSDYNFVPILRSKTFLSIRTDNSYRNNTSKAFFIVTFCSLLICIAGVVFSKMKMIITDKFYENTYKFGFITVIFIFSQPLLLYIRIPLPASLYSYLRFLLKFTYNPLAFGVWEFRPESPNLYSHHPPINFIQSFLLIIIVSGIILVIYLITKISKRKSILAETFKSQNIFSLLFMFEPQFFAFTFTTWMTWPKSASNWVSTIISFLFFIYYGIHFTIYIIFVIFGNCLQNTRVVSKYFIYLTAGYHSKPIYSSFDFFRSLIRLVMIFIAIKLQSHPTLQMGSFLLSSIIITILLVICKPWKLKYSNYIDIIQSLTFTAGVSLCISLPPPSISTNSSIEALGIAVSALMMTVSFVSAVFMIFVLFNEIFDAKICPQQVEGQVRVIENKELKGSAVDIDRSDIRRATWDDHIEITKSVPARIISDD